MNETFVGLFRPLGKETKTDFASDYDSITRETTFTDDWCRFALCRLFLLACSVFAVATGDHSSAIPSPLCCLLGGSFDGLLPLPTQAHPSITEPDHTPSCFQDLR